MPLAFSLDRAYPPIEPEARKAGVEGRDAAEPAIESCVDAAVDCVWQNFRKASRALTQFYDAALEPSGLRVTQVSLLVGLHLSGGATMSRLACDLAIDRTTLTRNLKPLVARGWLEIGREDDERVRPVAITDAGRQRVAAATPLWREAQRRVAGDIGETRLTGMIDDLNALVAALRRPGP